MAPTVAKLNECNESTYAGMYADFWGGGGGGWELLIFFYILVLRCKSFFFYILVLRCKSTLAYLVLFISFEFRQNLDSEASGVGGDRFCACLFKMLWICAKKRSSL